ncbi:MAG TPA: LPXTG cell wall anchor domain-containing protein [Catenuloplanes sp.]|jgi:hypothetical protein
MFDRPIRSCLAALGVAGALLAVAAAPVLAQAPTARLAVFQTDATVAAGGPARVVQPVLFATESLLLDKATFTFELTGLGNGVTFDKGAVNTDRCAAEAVRLVCTEHLVGVDEDGYRGRINVPLTAVRGASGVGQLRTTFSASGYQSASYTSEVRVGAGVDLSAGPERKASAAPGGAFTSPLEVRNAGSTVADGAVAVFIADHAIRAGKRHSNCLYHQDRLISCSFASTLAAGASYTAPVAHRLGKDTYAPGGAYAEIIWMTPADFKDYRAYLGRMGLPIGAPGAGDTLTLTRSGAARAAAVPQTDINEDNDSSGLEVTVAGRQGADLAAIGDTATAKVGDVVTATVGFVNNGPASIDASRSGGPITRVKVDIPAGTTAVEIPAGCYAMKDGEVDVDREDQPGASAYLCYSDSFAKVGESETVDFRLRVDKVTANATGAVMVNVPCQCEGFDEDLNRSNDTAKIVINPTTAAGPGAGQGGTPGAGQGGGLPVTGPATGLLAGAGALLVVGGTGLAFALARRRRTRFVA